MYRRLALLSTPLGLIFVIAIMVLPGSGAAQQSVGGTSIRTDRNQYRIGDPISICYTIPPGRTPIMLIDLTPDGRQTVILQGIDDGTGGCFQSVITGPTGNECLRLVVWAPGFPAPYVPAGQPLPGIANVIGDATACFRVTDQLGPLPPPSTGVAISTDRRQYIAGDQVQVCYNVPQSGAVVVSDLLADGRIQTVFAGDTAAGTACLPAGLLQAGPAIGNECVRVDAYLGRGAGLYGSAQTCFTVLQRIQPLPVPVAPGLRLNKQQFRVGETVQICYSVPGPGQLTLTLTDPQGRTGQLIGGLDDGTGGCTVVQATQPFGRWCVTLTAPALLDPRTVGGAVPNVTSQACYQVIGAG